VTEWLIRVLLIARILSRRCPGPESLGWIVLIALVPLIGLTTYVLLGERQLGLSRVRRHDEFEQQLVPGVKGQGAAQASTHPTQEWWARAGPCQQLAKAAEAVTGLEPTSGNELELIDHAPALLERLAIDIDAAEHHVHMIYYIVGQSESCVKVYEALERASARGVVCRFMADHVGSLAFFRSSWPARLQAAGVRVQRGLAVNIFRRRLHRIDLRNHRKIAVIDGAIGYCGSQNLLDERVRTRRVPLRKRPLLDANVRARGPCVRDLQLSFLADWLTGHPEHDRETQELTGDGAYLRTPERAGSSVVHVIPSGPLSRTDAIHQSIKTMLNVAHKSVVMTTPYFVPDEALKASIINASLRGVDVTLILPAHLDNYTVAAAARAHFAQLLESGVRIMQHVPHKADLDSGGLLHSKCAVVDDEAVMIGSANLDMRSFWINFECTLLIYDEAMARDLKRLHERYLGESVRINPAVWAKRTWWQNLRDNAAQLLAPLL